MRTALVTFIVFALLAASASAAETDVRGTWNCCTQSTNPAVGSQVTVITSEDLTTGQWSGWGYGGPYTWPISGKVTGSQITFSVPYYNQLRSYSAQGTGTLSGRSWQTSFTDSNGSTGSYVLTKATAPPPPVAGKAVDARTVSGTVLIKLPGTSAFADLSKVAVQLPVGTVVDTRHGTIELVAAQSVSSKKTATADFYDGLFRIGQKAAARAVTNLTLLGGNFKHCAGSASLAAQKTKVRQLWGKGHGLFRTTGKYASAAVRGTKWLVADYCDGTLIKVTQGAVLVHALNRSRRDIVLRAPRQIFIRAKR
jgi:hypothetical protein